MKLIFLLNYNKLIKLIMTFAFAEASCLCTLAGPTSNSVQLPEGPFTATNYSGTQMNFWGVAPTSVPPWVNGYDTPGQLGAVTNSVLQV